MQYLIDMREAVQNGVLKAEELRRRNGKLPTPINLRSALKPWFDSRFDYARPHINLVCQASLAIALHGIDLCGETFPVSAQASLPIMTNESLYTENLPEVSRVGWTEKAYAAK